MSLDLSPAPGAAPPAAQVRAQALMEVRLLLRNGEQLLLALVIPVLVLVGGVLGADRIGLDLAHRPVDVLTPGVLALAIMSTSFTSLAIATGFERRYGVLKRLGATPLPRWGCWPARCARCWWSRCCRSWCCHAVALVLGWSPSAGVVGAVGFVLACVAGHGGVRLARAAAGRVRCAPRRPWPPPTSSTCCCSPAAPWCCRARRTARSARVAQWLPSGALGDAMRPAFIDGSVAWASLLCLLGWAVVGGYLTARTFKWE